MVVSPLFPIEERLAAILEKRKQEGSLRQLKLSSGLVDFYSNDYLGFSRSLELEDLFRDNLQNLSDRNGRRIGSTGSRLLSGNSALAEELESMLKTFHQAEAALLFNSGYDANVGMISAFVRPGDSVFYDELVHASMHDGLKLARVKGIPFQHNDLDHLEALLAHSPKESKESQRFILVESIYSMDGDSAPLVELCQLAERYGANLLVDEAHATGIFGLQGQGLCVELGVQNKVFARLVTFSKALGTHGAVVLTTEKAKQYLVNFARSFIYSTASSLSSLMEVQAGYQLLQKGDFTLQAKQKVEAFQTLLTKYPQLPFLRSSQSMIQALFVPGNFEVRQMANRIQEAGFDLRPLVFPTVQKGKERIRICLHTFNTQEEMEGLLEVIGKVN
jgi:8-amino-7-oxononanoate synthase